MVVHGDGGCVGFHSRNHEGRARMIDWIQGLAKVLPAYQDKNGLWYQVLDQPKRKETSGSICNHAIHVWLKKAVNKGYIDPKYRAV